MKFKYMLDNKQKQRCPACGHNKAFTPYVYSQTRLPIDAEECGKCDRVLKCKYEMTPREYFNRHPTLGRPVRVMSEMHRIPPVCAGVAENFPDQTEAAHLTIKCNKRRNPLYRYMTSLTGHRQDYEQLLSRVFDLYHVGTAKKWGGSTVFWLTDSEGRFVDGKVMGYDDTTGKRIRKPTPRITWVSAIIARRDKKVFTVGNRPIFGQHLMTAYPTADVLVVESEKTALLLALALMDREGPEILNHKLPIAVGGCEGLTESKLHTLCNHIAPAPRTGNSPRCILLPDNGCLEKWQNVKKRLERLYNGVRVETSNIMENPPAGLSVTSGDDIGDIITQYYATLYTTA